ncbi:MAG: stage III sporulation protein AA [Lachnospiraceae bacterium]
MNYIFEGRLLDLLKIILESPTLEEIRMRLDLPLMIRDHGKDYFISESGRRTCEKRLAHKITEKELESVLLRIFRNSPYAYEKEMCQGYITLPGGHRIGLCGEMVYANGKIHNMNNIRSINIRIAGEQIGISRELLPYLYRTNGTFCNSLILSPPGGGKTTLLRDLIRGISEGDIWNMGTGLFGANVSVVDERGELSGGHDGKCEMNLGMQTDYLLGCGKPEGILQLIRTMTPAVIAVDEIGTSEDYSAIREAMARGVSVLATMHSNCEVAYGLSGLNDGKNGNCETRNGFPIAGFDGNSEAIYGLPGWPADFERIISIERKEDAQRFYHVYDRRGEWLC